MVPSELKKATELHRLTQEENPDYSKYRSSEFAIHGCESHLIDEKTARKNLSVYYAMVTLMDKYIGIILDKLDELDMTKNTIIVFTSDHGHFVGQHGLHKIGPFMFEDVIKVPYIVSCPGTVTENKVSSAMQSHVDLPVTFLDYLGLEIPFNWTGVNQRDVWEGREESARDHIICEFNHDRNSLNLRAYVDQKYKIVVRQDDMFGELYDLEADPKELNNLWDDPEYGNIKYELLMKYISAELRKESLFMPRIAHA